MHQRKVQQVRVILWNLPLSSRNKVIEYVKSAIQYHL